MEMQFSRTCDYAIRAVIQLADGGWQKAKVLSESSDIPQNFVPQVLGHLVRAGIVTSLSGRSGGYRLARNPEEISLLELVEAIEGPLQSSRCVLGNDACDVQHLCAVHPFWSHAQTALRSSLGSTSVQQLVRHSR